MREPFGNGLYNDEAVKRIVRRAVEIDQQSDAMASDADIAHIAKELQISPAALNQALLEVQLESAVGQSESRLAFKSDGGFNSPVNPLVMSLLGLATPILINTVSPLVARSFILASTVATMFAVQAVVVALATSYEGESQHERWQLLNLTTWFGFAAGFVFIGQPATVEFWPFLVAFGGISAAAGSMVIALRQALRTRRSAGGGDGTDGTDSLKIRVLRRVKRVLDRIWVIMQSIVVTGSFNHANSKPEFS